MKEFFKNVHLHWQDKANEFAADNVDRPLVLILAFLSAAIIGIVFIPCAIYIVLTKSIFFKLLGVWILLVSPVQMIIFWNIVSECGELLFQKVDRIIEEVTD
jgi:hypothetical protein